MSAHAATPSPSGTAQPAQLPAQEQAQPGGLADLWSQWVGSPEASRDGAPSADDTAQPDDTADPQTPEEVAAAIHEELTYDGDDVIREELESLHDVGNPTGSALSPDGDYEYL